MELPNCCLLFDYYEGNIPPVPDSKPLYVFVSHQHQDHFNPEIFSIQSDGKVHYILSDDVKRRIKNQESLQNLHFLKPSSQLTFADKKDADTLLTIQTLPSTDCGVAFLINYKGKYIYHAGDLNWWVWKGESKQYNNNMTANFKKYTEPLKNLDLFAAFLPLDPRQEEWYDKGILHILENASVKYAFPMHFWKDFSIIQKFIASPAGAKYKEHIIQLEKEGQTFDCPDK